MLYLVTGGAGFIGHHLVERLLRDGHQVRVLDNLSTGKRERIPQGAEFFELDFTKLDEIRPAFVGVDGVFHVGALPRILFSIEYPIESFQANTFGTLNVLVAARDAGVKRVVYSGSSSAYGNTETLPNRPDMPANPMNPYALQKYNSELLIKQFSDIYGLETVILRYFNVYGPGMADSGSYVTVISVFARQRKAGEPLTIHGDGEQSRDFTYVYDAVDANVRAMESDSVGHGEVLNVGGGRNFTVNYIASIFGGSVERKEGRKAEARHTLSDISKTKELLGWEPSVRFEDGLRETIKWFGL